MTDRFPYPSEDGWPYPDADDEVDDLELADPAATVDDDLISLHALPRRIFDGLEPMERAVLDGRYALEGHPLRSMHQLQLDLGATPAQLQTALGTGLEKLRLKMR